MQGRLHRYEGYSLQQVTFPVRVLRALGAATLVVSNACGGMHPLWSAGDVMLIADHINLLGDNPLIGPNDETLGPRFPDMSAPYDAELRDMARAVALAEGITIREGVYAAVQGPNLETRAEYRFLRLIGADVVGMSTVPEVIVARHGGMRVLGLSIITDQCLPDALAPANIDDIIKVGACGRAEVGSRSARSAGAFVSDSDNSDAHDTMSNGNGAGKPRFPLIAADLSADALEQQVLAGWRAENLFARTLAAREGAKPYVFFEGPPTANGRPGIHHVFARTVKDLFCRHRAMQGHLVLRKAGLDTHGLPVEIEVEKELQRELQARLVAENGGDEEVATKLAANLGGKQLIEQLGVAEFNRRCRENVWKYRRGLAGDVGAYRVLARLRSSVRDV